MNCLKETAKYLVPLKSKKLDFLRNIISINLLNKNILTDNTLCIVFKKISNEFENKYINTICTFLKKKNINIMIMFCSIIKSFSKIFF